jgi:hypothetical protein
MSAIAEPGQEIPCTMCGDPTRMLGTKLCDGCWECRRGISRKNAAAVLQIVLEALLQPIDTAPKDGTNIIAGIPGLDRSTGEMFWFNGAWRTWDGENHQRTIAYPTHWIAIPRFPGARP